MRNSVSPFRRNGIRRKSLIFAWGLYDLANQAFALNIVSFYFVRWIIIDKQTPELLYGISFGFSLILVAFLASFFGAVSDLLHRHRFFLVLFTLLSIIFTLSLGLTQSVFLALVFFGIANFGCQAASIFYNALLVNIAPPDKIGLVSGVGKMLGYCGGALALLIVYPFVRESGRHAAFVPTGLFFLIFSLPCMLFIKDKEHGRILNFSSFLEKDKIKQFFRQFLGNTLDLIKSHSLSNFLKAAFFFLCVVNTIIVFMSVYVTQVFGLTESQILKLMIFSTFFAVAGSLLSGYASDRIGYKRSLLIVLILWGVCLIAGASARSMLLYWSIGPLVGVTLGSTWVVSRALAIHIVPPERIGQVFGLFFIVSLLSAAAGSFFWGGVLWFLSSLGELGYRIALLSLFLFLVPGFVYLRRI